MPYDSTQQVDMRGLELLVGRITATDESTISGVGAKNGATVTVSEEGNSVVHRTVLTLTATPITLTDEAGAGQYGGVKIYDLPVGLIQFLGARIDAGITLTATQWTDTAEGDVGLGTTAVTDGNALATTEQNIIPTTAIAAMVAQAGPIDASSSITQAGVVVDGTGGALDVFLNVRIDDAAAHITDGGFITGVVSFTWINLSAT